MRFIVYGAGAIGGVIGARLQQSGRDVVLVARGAHYEAIRDDGLTLVEPHGVSSKLTIPVVDRIAGARPLAGDVVILAMKTQDTEAAVRELAEIAPPELAVVCSQNGVENERLAARRFAHVYGMLVNCPGVHLEPGVVELYAAPTSGVLDLGRFPSGSDATSKSISEALGNATFASAAREEIMPWKYAKLVHSNITSVVVALAGVEALTSALGEILRDEAQAVLHAAGIPFVPAGEFHARIRLAPFADGPRPGNSSWQSLARGTGSIETDYLNGEIVLIARRHGIPAAANVLLQHLAREAASSGAAPGSVPVEQILERLAQLS